MKKLLLLILPFLLVACGNDKDEPRPAKLDGCYYLSHTKIETSTPVGDGFYSTKTEEKDYNVGFWYDINGVQLSDIPVSLYFDNGMIYWYCADLPAHPNQYDYPDDAEGMCEYAKAFETWYEQCQWDYFGEPGPPTFYTSTYKVSNGSLFIGKADMGKIAIDPDKFTLEYSYTNPAGQILKKIFTYTYYPSFNKGDI